jgi:hypothetical protein
VGARFEKVGVILGVIQKIFLVAPERALVPPLLANRASRRRKGIHRAQQPRSRHEEFFFCFFLLPGMALEVKIQLKTQRGTAVAWGYENVSLERRGISCSFWVGSDLTHERRPFPAHPVPAGHVHRFLNSGWLGGKIGLGDGTFFIFRGLSSQTRKKTRLSAQNPSLFRQWLSGQGKRRGISSSLLLGSFSQQLSSLRVSKTIWKHFDVSTSPSTYFFFFLMFSSCI